MNAITPLPLKNIKLQDDFWNKYMSLVREKVITYQWEILNDRIPNASRSHCIKNFEIAAGIRKGEYYGMVFQDSDLYKWLESVAYSLETLQDAALEKLADEAIALIGAAQKPDGYINTYYTIYKPKERWTNLQQGHELYCAGHLIEAAVAHFNATNKRTFLEIAIRFADCIDNTFGIEDGKIQGYPGHQVIELALCKLYKVTNEQRYLKLAEYFIRQRGRYPNYFDLEQKQPGYSEIFPEVTPLSRTYSQSHIPITEQKKACGHAVRAVYMYSAMADLATELDDQEILSACETIYQSITQQQMYITGAIGSTPFGESFTADYDLPNDMVYGETCASIGLMMFCRRMHGLTGDSKYIDTMERALYNSVISGISLTGTEFFYVNPLEVDPEQIKNNPGFKHVKAIRQKWFDCSCCPTNVSRTITGLGGYIYAKSGQGLYVNLYVASTVTDASRIVTVKTDYPYGKTAVINVSGGTFKLMLRNPGDAPIVSIKINGREQDIQLENGYMAIENNWHNDEIVVVFNNEPRLVFCSTAVQKNVGKAVVMRGPIVYCIEGVDNGKGLGALMLAHGSKLVPCPTPEGLPNEAVALEAKGLFYTDRPKCNLLYQEKPPALTETSIKLIPYYLWANRGENEMRVYIPILPALPGHSSIEQKK